MGALSDVYRNAVFSGNYLRSMRMVGMFMGDEDCFYNARIESHSLHPSLCFPAGNARINKYAFVLIAYVVAVSVASRID